MCLTLISIEEVMRDIEVVADIIELPYQVSLLLSSPCTKTLRTIMFGSSVGEELYRFSISIIYRFISILSYF